MNFARQSFEFVTKHLAYAFSYINSKEQNFQRRWNDAGLFAIFVDITHHSLPVISDHSLPVISVDSLPVGRHAD